eukprot:51364-Prorocentrum_minimum.AAC.2
MTGMREGSLGGKLVRVRDSRGREPSDSSLELIRLDLDGADGRARAQLNDTTASEVGKAYGQTTYLSTTFKLGFPGSGCPGSRCPGLGLPGLGFPGLGFPGLGFPGLWFPGSVFPGSEYPGLGFPGIRFPGLGFPRLWFPGSGSPGVRVSRSRLWSGQLALRVRVGCPAGGCRAGRRVQ